MILSRSLSKVVYPAIHEAKSYATKTYRSRSNKTLSKSSRKPSSVLSLEGISIQNSAQTSKQTGYAVYTLNRKAFKVPIQTNISSITSAPECYAKKTDKSKGGPVKESGGRLGTLDAATEAGFFHKINKASLEELKKTIKIKKKEEPDEKDEKK